MSRGRISAPFCAASLALGLTACGSTVATSSFKGEQRAVAQTISNLQSHVTTLEKGKVCSEDLASAVVARLNHSPQGCSRAIEAQIKEIDSPEATVESVQITGVHATAHVKSIYAGKSRAGTMTLVKEAGKWKISGLG